MISGFSRFNEQDYLDANPDVREAVSLGHLSSGLSHYKKFGKKEGRPLKFFKTLSRLDKVFYKLNKKGLGLEIGPSHNPIAPKKQGFNVHILDHASAQDQKINIQGMELISTISKRLILFGVVSHSTSS